MYTNIKVIKVNNIHIQVNECFPFIFFIVSHVGSGGAESILYGRIALCTTKLKEFSINTRDHLENKPVHYTNEKRDSNQGER